MAKKSIVPKDRLLPKLTMFLFGKTKTVLFVWLILLVFGATSYTTFLRREGFPNINIPIVIVNGTYFVNDAYRVDTTIAKPITDVALASKGVSTVQSTSAGNFFSVAVQYEESISASKAADELRAAVDAAIDLPDEATVNYDVPYFGATGGDIKKIDSTISFYDKNGKATTEELANLAQQAVDQLNTQKPSLVENFFVNEPFQTAVNPSTGQSVTVQKTFDRFGTRSDSNNTYFNSVIIGVSAVAEADVIKLDNQIRASFSDLASRTEFAGYSFAISASFAPAINQEIGELQRVLLEGLLAVLVIGSIVIAVRASLITVLSMITVIAITLAVLYIIGYTLNVITLFALILGLSLIVDDTIIMIEAIDASRRHHTNARAAVKTAVNKISRAMVAATFTAVLSFAPLLFAGGVLGSFIRAIPITIIAALLISLAVALVFIPQFARMFILGKKQMGENGVKELAAGFEASIARAICRPMLWARRSQKRLVTVGLGAVIIGLVFIGAGGYVFSKVTFNLFPPTKDTNAISVKLSYPNGITIQEAQRIADQADSIIGQVVGSNFEQATYFGNATESSATVQVDLVDYSKRDITSQQLVKELQSKFDNEFTLAAVKVAQVDVRPPSAGFTVQIQTEDRQAGFALANEIVSYLASAELVRPSGTTARFTQPSVSSPGLYIRHDSKLNIDVTADFDADDTTTLVTLAQSAVKKEFNNERLAKYNLSTDNISFDIGQESDNQESFKTLVVAFPVLLVAIYILLAVQFRSLLQPLLIFMAVPFSIFGIMNGLYFTNNAFSFFVAMGFFALIGLSIKNTILLTDYANQSKANGMGTIDSTVAALGERFRPLIATSLTAVVSLIPLAIISPFWQGLAVTLIFGLLSSTLLVILIFPYYYLGGEYLRLHISRKEAITGLLVTGLLLYSAISLGTGIFGVVVSLIIAIITMWQLRRLKRSSNT